MSNIRPISLLPLPGKLLEYFVLSGTVKSNLINSFGNNQFGGRPGSSTTAALIKLMDDATLLLDRDDIGGLHIISYDFKKAFDKLRHDIIIQKLSETNVPRGFLHLTYSYLEDRKQAVRIGDNISTTTNILSGVPQGSLIGSYLYCVVAASLTPVHHSTRMIKYIDDVTLCIPIFKTQVCSNVSEEHANISSWSLANGLSLNYDKCKSLFIRKVPSCLPTLLNDVKDVDELRILGVILNSQLRWDSHITKQIRTASQRMYGLRILKPLVPPSSLAAIYHSLIRSLFEYASSVFIQLPAHLESRLNRFQNRIHKMVCSLPKDFRATDCPCGKFPPLKRRREEAAVKLFHLSSKNENHILHGIMPDISCRSGRYLQPYSATSRRFNSFVPYTCALFEGILVQ